MSISIPFYATYIEGHPFPNVYAWICGPRIGLVMQTEEYQPRTAYGSDPGALEQLQNERKHLKRIAFHAPFIEKILESPEEEWVEMRHTHREGMMPFPFRMLYAGERKDGSVHFNQGMLKEVDGQEGLIPMYSADLPESICKEIIQAIGAASWETMVRPEEIWEAMKNETQTGEDV